MKVTIISYGIAILIIAALVHYLTLAGIESCNSMTGIVSTYTSKDYAQGCRILSNIQTAAIGFEVAGSGIAIFGIIRRSKSK
ncbi:MAG TPA: hypothetical protein VJ792_05375 [Candidatus Nitrosotalea sp.]|nr:hypothetical protein [Candidatus Nitrosotalea sp.]